MTAATKNSEAPSGTAGSGGRRLAAAFAALDTLPALTETVSRIAALSSKRGTTVAELAEAVESDAVAVMRAANNDGRPRGLVAGLPDAVEVLGPAGTKAAVADLATYELFQNAGAWEQLPERFRRHALATRHAAERVAELGEVPRSDELAAAALMHDVGQLVLTRLYPRYTAMEDDRAATPEERARRERRELGIDHTWSAACWPVVGACRR
jgi:HD-like signal output (HDOD) protein